MIPKIIHKVIIVEDGKLPKLPEGWRRAIETWYKMNPGYKVVLYSGDDCIEYIKKYFDDDILKSFIMLKSYAYRCDFFRHLLLYNEGGWYTDSRMVCMESLDTLMRQNKEYYTSTDLPINVPCMCIGFIGSIAKHPISKKMIDLVMLNIKHRHYGINPLYPTGPCTYINASIDYIRFHPDKCSIGKRITENGSTYIEFGDCRILRVKYNDAEGGDNTDIKGTNNYNTLWYSRDVYDDVPE